MYKVTLKHPDGTIETVTEGGWLPDVEMSCALYEQIGYEVLDVVWTGGCV